VLRRFLERLLPRYLALFCGDAQVLAKLREPLAFVTAPALRSTVTAVRRARTVAELEALLANMSVTG